MHGKSLQIQLLGTVSHFVDWPVLINEIVSFLKRTGGTSLVRMVFLDHDSNNKMYRFMQCAGARADARDDARNTARAPAQL